MQIWSYSPSWIRCAYTLRIGQSLPSSMFYVVSSLCLYKETTFQPSPTRIRQLVMHEKKFNASSKELAKQLIEQAEYNCTGQNINFTIEDIKPLSEEGAYLVFASSRFCRTTFVCYEDGTAFFLRNWTSHYPESEEEIENYDWVTIDWKDLPFCIGGLPRQLHIG